jgi:hypothetical protein
MEKAEIFIGYLDGGFGGRKPASRQEVVNAVERLTFTRMFDEPHSDLAADVFLEQFAPAALPQNPSHPIGGPPFADVPNFCFMADPNELGREGLVRGYPDYTFRPHRALSRDELAVIAVRLLRRLQYRPSLDAQRAFFRDVSGDEWWFGAMLVAVEAGVMDGYPDRSFRGSQPVTRNELAVALARLLELAKRTT